MLKDTERYLLISLIFIAATLASFAVLNRWIVTDIGLLSYGRVWPLYVSYLDMGFIRRGLIGSAFTESGFNSLFDNEYFFALFIHHAAICLLAFIIAYFCASRSLIGPIFIIGIAFSPALIIHSGYTTGTLDVFVLIFAALNMLFVRNALLFSLILAVGILTHELSIFTVPAQLVAWNMAQQDKSSISRVSAFIFPVTALLVAIVAVTVFGTNDMTQDAIERIMAQRLPNAQGQHGLWSGYFEISSSAEENSTGALKTLLNIGHGVLFLSIPLTYIAILAFRLNDFAKDRFEYLLFLGAVIAPLLTSIVATDLYRWIAMSANMAILLTLLTAARERKTMSRWNMVLLIFCLLAPFGSAELQRPFPMHQFIFEKVVS